jgi:hypothetical protein
MRRKRLKHCKSFRAISAICTFGSLKCAAPCGRGNPPRPRSPQRRQTTKQPQARRTHRSKHSVSVTAHGCATDTCRRAFSSGIGHPHEDTGANTCSSICLTQYERWWLRSPKPDQVEPAPLSYSDAERVSPQAFFISLMHLDRNFLRTFPCRPFASACLEHSIDAALRGVAGAFSFICATATLPDARNARLRAAANFHIPDSPNQDAKAVTKATPRQQRHGRAPVPSARGTNRNFLRAELQLHSISQSSTCNIPTRRDSNLHRLVATRGASIVVPCALRVPPDRWPSQNY